VGIGIGAYGGRARENESKLCRIHLCVRLCVRVVRGFAERKDKKGVFDASKYVRLCVCVCVCVCVCAGVRV
jgi:hypothetical protein